MALQHIDETQLKTAYAAIKGISIPSIPQTLMSLQQELNSQEPDQGKVIALISEDISLSGKVIKRVTDTESLIDKEVTESLAQEEEMEKILQLSTELRWKNSR